MSIFKSMIKPLLEREIASLEPEISHFILNAAKKVAVESIEWIEERIKLDLNGDGKIGSKE